jgi:hypothetical protein
LTSKNRLDPESVASNQTAAPSIATNDSVSEDNNKHDLESATKCLNPESFVSNQRTSFSIATRVHSSVDDYLLILCLRNKGLPYLPTSASSDTKYVEKPGRITNVIDI